MEKYKNYLILIILTMGSQTLLYYSIKLIISDYNVINSIINVPLIKYFVYFYDSWYPFIILNTVIIYKYDKDLFKYLIVSMVIAALFSHLTFIIYPSMVERPLIEVHGITDWLLDFTYKSDMPAVNCLPSVHCIYCFVTSFYIVRSKNLNNVSKVVLVLFSFLIVLSTLFIKQHIVEDVILSLIYTVISLLIVYLNKDLINKFLGRFC